MGRKRSKGQARTSLSGYFKGLGERVTLQLNVMTPTIVHGVEMGDNDHQWFADILRQYLPTRVGLATGFVVNVNSDKASADFFAPGTARRDQDPSISPQCDILLLDILNNAPFCVEKTFSVCPIEMVIGVVEVTRFLDASKLEEDLEKIRRVRDLAAVKKYTFTDDRDAEERRPLGFVVGLDGNVTLKTIREKIDAIADDNLRPNAVVILTQGLYVRKPRTTDFYRVEDDVLYQFLTALRLQVERFPCGGTDLKAYLPALAKVCSLEQGRLVERDPEDGEEFDEDSTSHYSEDDSSSSSYSSSSSSP